jgi:integrase
MNFITCADQNARAMKLKPTIKDPATSDGRVNIKIALSHRHKVRYIKTNIYVQEEQFDGWVIDHPLASRYNIQLRTQMNEIEEKLLPLGGKLDRMDIKDILNFLQDKNPTYDFFAYSEYIIEKLTGNYALSVKQTIDKLKHYDPYFNFEAITVNWLNGFKDEALKTNSVNTVAIHLRNLRMIINRAIDDGLSTNYPFRKFKIKGENTPKKGLSIEDVKFIKSRDDLKDNERYARDIWLLSFYLIGINYKDLFQIRKINSGRIYYNRSKTGAEMSVKVFPQAKEIIERYNLNVPNYKQLMDWHNRLLKRVYPGLTTYHARHSWATIAYNLGVSVDVIALALGHQSPNRVTPIYINPDLKRVDDANGLVINAIQ